MTQEGRRVKRKEGKEGMQSNKVRGTGQGRAASVSFAYTFLYCAVQHEVYLVHDLKEKVVRPNETSC